MLRARVLRFERRRKIILSEYDREIVTHSKSDIQAPENSELDPRGSARAPMNPNPSAPLKSDQDIFEAV
jgi:hypothetical protein